MAPKIKDEKQSQRSTQTLRQPLVQPAFHHQFLSLSAVQNRAAVKHFHPFLLLASLFILLQVFPPLLASSSTVFFQVFLWHSCILTPWGFRRSVVFAISPLGFLLLFNWAWGICPRCTTARRLIVLPFLDVPTFATSLSSSVQPEKPLVVKGGTAWARIMAGTFA